MISNHASDLIKQYEIESLTLATLNLSSATRRLAAYMGNDWLIRWVESQKGFLMSGITTPARRSMAPDRLSMLEIESHLNSILGGEKMQSASAGVGVEVSNGTEEEESN